MMYYVLVLLFAAHLALFWYGNTQRKVEPILFAIVLALFTTYAPLYPGIEFPKDSGGVFSVQDPSTALASFVLLVIYASKLIGMTASSVFAREKSRTAKPKPRWP